MEELLAALTAEVSARALDAATLEPLGYRAQPLCVASPGWREAIEAAVADGVALRLRLCTFLGNAPALQRRLRAAGWTVTSPAPHTLLVVAAGAPTEAAAAAPAAPAPAPAPAARAAAVPKRARGGSAAAASQQHASVPAASVAHASAAPPPSKRKPPKGGAPAPAPAPASPAPVAVLPTRAELTWKARSAAEVQAAVRQVLARLQARAAGGGLSAATAELTCTEGATVQPQGELEGNCAFASLLRSSGAVFGGRGGERELDACAALRRATTARLAVRLLREGSDLAETMAAVGVASDAGSGSRGGGGGGSGAAARAWEAACRALTPSMAAAFRGLGRHLAVGRVADATAYAGPLELTELAAAAARDIIIFSEAGAADDGAVFLAPRSAAASATAAAALPPPLVAVNTRRRHMRPIRISLTADGSDVSPLRASELADEAMRNLAGAIEAGERRKHGADAPTLAAARALLARLGGGS